MTTPTKDHPQREMTRSELKEKILRSYEAKKAAGGFQVKRIDNINDPIINLLKKLKDML